MSIVSHVRLMIEWPSQAPDEVTDKWSENLQGEAERLNARRQRVIPDDGAYQSVLAEPSAQGYEGYPDSAFYSRSGRRQKAIRDAQRSRVKEGFAKWAAKLNRAFETVEGVVGKRFKEAVEAMRTMYSQGAARRPLPFVGMKSFRRGPASIAGYWLTNDGRVIRMLRGGDEVLEGGPFEICPPPKRAALKAALTERLVQAGINILNSGFDAETITYENQLTAEIIQGFTDPAKDLIPFTGGGDSHVDFVMVSGQPYVDIQVSTM